MSLKKFESIILEFRYFLDEALTFVEVFESREREPSGCFYSSTNEINSLRKFAIEYTRYVFDLKKMLTNMYEEDAYEENEETVEFGDLNNGLVFTESFKVKRLQFFTILFSRLDKLFDRFEESSFDVDESVGVYFKLVQKLSRRTNELIGYFESTRWHRAIAIDILDRLAVLANDYLCAFEKFIEYLSTKGKIKFAEKEKKKKERLRSSDLWKTNDDFKQLKPLYNKLVYKISKILINLIFLNIFGIFRYKKSSNYEYCPCVYLILLLMILTISLVLFRVFNLFESKENVDGEVKKSGNQKEFDIFGLIDFEPFEMEEEEENDEKEVKKSNAEVAPYVYQSDLFASPWTQVLNYMRKAHLILISLSTFITFEWYLKD